MPVIRSLLAPLFIVAALAGCEKAHTPPTPKLDDGAINRTTPETRMPASNATQPETHNPQPTQR